MEGQYVNKLRIVALRKPDFRGGLGAVLGSLAVTALQSAIGGVFELQINPEQFSRHFKVEFACPDEPSNIKAKTPQFTRVTSELLDLKFTIDGTGIIPIQQPAIDAFTQVFALAGDNANVAYVSTKIAQLQATVYGIIDEMHRPPFLMITWGKLVFIGVLEDMTHVYNLFDPSGLPLRAEVSMKIKEYVESSALSRAMSLLSPDLTRKRQVKSSDNILTLCEEVYEKPDYYLEVAKANNLSNFRRIEAGKELLFPPVAK
jgi:Contractile injection system tube protein